MFVWALPFFPPSTSTKLLSEAFRCLQKTDELNADSFLLYLFHALLNNLVNTQTLLRNKSTQILWSSAGMKNCLRTGRQEHLLSHKHMDVSQ